mmetsp:Transcript_9324/g.23458  ORF Transcript_9324/g.23458 Transcript_9324/m.23458 type:complete len:243 (+) Transcript_9324:850-1578(+)
MPRTTADGPGGTQLAASSHTPAGNIGYSRLPLLCECWPRRTLAFAFKGVGIVTAGALRNRISMTSASAGAAPITHACWRKAETRKGAGSGRYFKGAGVLAVMQEARELRKALEKRLGQGLHVAPPAFFAPEAHVAAAVYVQGPKRARAAARRCQQCDTLVGHTLEAVDREQLEPLAVRRHGHDAMVVDLNAPRQVEPAHVRTALERVKGEVVSGSWRVAAVGVGRRLAVGRWGEGRPAVDVG